MKPCPYRCYDDCSFWIDHVPHQIWRGVWYWRSCEGDHDSYKCKPYAILPLDCVHRKNILDGSKVPAWSRTFSGRLFHLIVRSSFFVPFAYRKRRGFRLGFYGNGRISSSPKPTFSFFSAVLCGAIPLERRWWVVFKAREAQRTVQTAHGRPPSYKLRRTKASFTIQVRNCLCPSRRGNICITKGKDYPFVIIRSTTYHLTLAKSYSTLSEYRFATNIIEKWRGVSQEVLSSSCLENQ